MILPLLFLGLILPMLLGFCLGRWRTDLSRRRILWYVSLPFPVLLAVPSLFVIVSTLLTPGSRCGTDACGMAIGFGLMGLAAAALFLGLGLALGWAGLALARRNGDARLTEPFE
ncbi:hypothetical protein [Novosphingobium sp. PASSN1]|uniref:hypothetical protein n=1 Tax=Novosphingobium sp. PASSN1 TaxID=2015561 RepID=UPI000BC43A36|nr:hypothetical protein [Novosphingobium sp. PASSN1]OYU34877.1 MAG: hypothetical protein CFE35_13410 [Novosphingobium sp. PASSN1]